MRYWVHLLCISKIPCIRIYIHTCYRPYADAGWANSPVASQVRAPTPPAPSGITSSLSAPIPDESNIFRHVLTNVLRQSTDSPLI